MRCSPPVRISRSGMGPITKAQIALEHRFCNVIGAKITGFNFRTNLPSGLGYVPLPP